MFLKYNPNPNDKRVGDCVVRAISIATGYSWERIYIELCLIGFIMGDWGDSNTVWDIYLTGRGFERYSISNSCPNCYTVIDFCRDHPYGTYILANGKHVVAVIDGDYIDTWDSGDVVPVFYYRRR